MNMATNKTLGDWEKEKGVIIISISPDVEMTEAEFKEIDFKLVRGVNHKDRTKFLKDNGHKVTRENMINPDLSVRQSKTKKK